MRFWLSSSSSWSQGALLQGQSGAKITESRDNNNKYKEETTMHPNIVIYPLSPFIISTSGLLTNRQSLLISKQPRSSDVGAWGAGGWWLQKRFLIESQPGMINVNAASALPPTFVKYLENAKGFGWKGVMGAAEWEMVCEMEMLQSEVWREDREKFVLIMPSPFSVLFIHLNSSL